MKILKFILTPFLLAGLYVSLTASAPSTSIVSAKSNSEQVNTSSTTTKANLNEKKFTYKELKKIATDLKGEKLTFKEKLGLKLFGKKFSKKASNGGNKSQLVALLLCGFLGGLGIHRFYLGYTWQGIVQLLTLGGCGIWSLIDFIRIATGSLKPKDSEYDTTL